MKIKSFYILASFLLLLAVIIGAYGAHGLSPFMGENGMTTFKTGSRYHFYHGFAIFIVLLINNNFKIKHLNRITYFFLAGIICFSGSLYLFSIKSLFNDGFIKILGPITPIGGLFFIIGWVLLMISFMNKSNEK